MSPAKGASLGVPAVAEAVLEAAGLAGFGVTVIAISDTPRNVFVSPRAAEILGRSVDELMIVDFFSTIAPRDRDRLKSLLAEFLEKGGPPSEVEVDVVRADGSLVTVSAASSMVKEGDQSYSVTFLRDVTERHREAMAIRRSEQQLRSLVEHAPESVFIWRGSEILYMNPAGRKMLGLGPDSPIEGLRWADFLVEPDAESKGVRREAEILAGMPVEPNRYRVRAGDGRVLVVEVTSIKVAFDDEPAMLTFGRDISAREALEEQLALAERLNALGAVAAGVAHEINNPLSYVSLSLDAVSRRLDGALPESPARSELQKLVREGQQGCDRMRRIVRDLGELSRSTVVEVGPVELPTVIRSALRMTEHQLAARATVVCELGRTPRVKAAAFQLEQVVINLLMNAAEAMPDRPAEQNLIKIRLGTAEGAEAVARLEVSDNGVGIDPHAMPRIFEPLFTTKWAVGTGLGLAISRRILRSLGGDIEVRSAVGEGTTFTVTLRGEAG